MLWGAATGADDDSDYWERRLPARLGELSAAKPEAERFDAIVVDEGQDFGELWWPPTLAYLRDARNGGLFAFLDEAQRVFARRGKVPIQLPPYALAENIRNTKASPRPSGASRRRRCTFAAARVRRSGSSGGQPRTRPRSLTTRLTPCSSRTAGGPATSPC